MKLSTDYQPISVGADPLEFFQERYETLAQNIASVVVTSPENIQRALLGLFAQGHILLEDLPGVGKTLLAKTLAASIDGQFSRIQFTPDLLPSDITGTSVFDMQQQTFQFVPGPIFAHVVLADELNRAGPRTQSALLEAMAESQVSADGTARPLPLPFLVIATQNLIESYGTFPLPNSQLDRFMVTMSLGLPTREQELEILRRAERGATEVTPVLTTDEIIQMQTIVANIDVVPSVLEYIVNLAAASRESDHLSVGVSPRASAALLRACHGWAAFDGRPFVIPEDVKQLAPYVWGHRVQLDSQEGLASGYAAIERLLQSAARLTMYSSTEGTTSSPTSNGRCRWRRSPNKRSSRRSTSTGCSAPWSARPCTSSCCGCGWNAR